MGWMFGWSSRKDLVDHVTATFENDQRRISVIKKFYSGNNLWTVWERQSKVAPTDKERFIVVFLILGGNNCTGGQGHGWGYKDVSEDMGPCEVTCPLSFLDMVPDPGGYATAWRERVRKHWATRNQKIVVGQTVILTNGQDYVITKVKGFNKIYGMDSRFCEWRIPRKMLTLQTAQEASSLVMCLQLVKDARNVLRA